MEEMERRFPALLRLLASGDEEAVLEEGFAPDALARLFAASSAYEAFQLVSQVYLASMHGTPLSEQYRLGGDQLVAGMAKVQAKVLTASSTYLRLAGRVELVEQVTAGRMSRVEVAKLLHVHQATVAKWVKQANELLAQPPLGADR